MNSCDTAQQFPADIAPMIEPQPHGELAYRCLGCDETFGIEHLLYTCPTCREVLMIEDLDHQRLKTVSGPTWRRLFDYRKMTRQAALKGIYRYHEFLGPVLPTEAIIYLGEAHTPIVEANGFLQERIGQRFFFKNDGQNPSASFKDRGMASALSYIHYLLLNGHVDEVLAVCASTGDTSAAAALYASYLNPRVKSAVLLPKGKVTPQQLSQPLGSGAMVFEVPGVFDDCMKVVEALSENYPVALLNSKNAWRILGQESYSFEIAQDLGYDLEDVAVIVPIGNAGNITAVMNGFLKFFDAGVIESLPKIVGVQSHHADPVYRYYSQPETERLFKPVTVQPSVAQAAMIGNPVSMPRVQNRVTRYNEAAGVDKVFFVQATEQEIIDSQLTANRNGHVACPHGGECLAGLVAAKAEGFIKPNETAILDSTAHAIKFSGFQDIYFSEEIDFDPAYEICKDPQFINRPIDAHPGVTVPTPAWGKPLGPEDQQRLVEATVAKIAAKLGL